MKKKTSGRGPTSNDICRRPEEIEIRQIEIHREGMEPPSSKTVYYYCPFCGDEVKAYVWSFTASGKRCYCGALTTGNSGRTAQFKRLIKNEKENTKMVGLG